MRTRGGVRQLQHNSLGCCAGLKRVLGGVGDDFGAGGELLPVEQAFEEGLGDEGFEGCVRGAGFSC